MIRLKTGNVESLFDICSITVANQLAKSYDKMTASNRDEEDGKSYSNSSVLNPYNEWPLLLLERVIHVLRMRFLLNVRHRDLLINMQTRKLDFSSFCALQNRNMVVQLVQLAVLRCPQLTDLVFSNMSCQCKVEDYLKFLPQFKDLQVLDVKSNFKNFDDRCLKILGVHCRVLRKLNVDYCHVTDVGIKWLCGLCKSIEELVITNTKITPHGATLALQRLPHLGILTYEFMVETFSLMHLDQVDLAHPEFALTKLNLFMESWKSSSFSPYQTRLLRPAVSLCPLLTHLFIRLIEGVTDTDLLGITALERLSVFSVCNVCRDSCRITFDGSLAPILKTRGRSLNSLSLDNISNTFLCLASIIECCPNLEYLTLFNCKYLPVRLDQDLGISRGSKRVNSDFEWKRLQRLTLSNRCDIMAEVFLLILISSPALEYLSISYCSTLTDDVLQRVFQCNSFKNLEMLLLVHCPYVTERGINLFRIKENKVQLIRINNCGNLAK